MEEYSYANEKLPVEKSSFDIFGENVNFQCDTSALQIILDTIIDQSQDVDIGMSGVKDVLLSQTLNPKNNRTVKKPLKTERADNRAHAAKENSTQTIEKSLSSNASTTLESAKEKHGYLANNSSIKDNRPHKILYEERDGKVLRRWQCRTCLREFRHQYTLVRHLPTHTDVRNFVCRECGKAFRQLSTLTQHRAIHSTARPYACEICEKTFNRSSTLISHRKTHTGVKPFHCSFCSKGFHQKGNLKNHIYIHTNERPYRCTLCDKGFNQMSNLVCHTQKTHPSQCDSLWTCNLCSMSFTKRSLLRAHELTIHRIPGTNVTSNRRKLATILKSTPATSGGHVQPISNESTEIRKFEIFENGLLIPAINTNALKIARKNQEIPFAVFHFFEGPPYLVRVIDHGNQSLLRPVKNEDFAFSKKQEEEKICIPIVAAIYQSVNGQPEFSVMPPKNIYTFGHQPQAIYLKCSSHNACYLSEEQKSNESIAVRNESALAQSNAIPFISSTDVNFNENTQDFIFKSSANIGIFNGVSATAPHPSGNGMIPLISLTDVKDEEINFDDNAVNFNFRSSASIDDSWTVPPPNGIISFETPPDIKDDLSIFDENRTRSFTEESIFALKYATPRPPPSPNGMISFVPSADIKDQERMFYENTLDFNFGLAQEYIQAPNSVPSIIPARARKGMISFFGENEIFDENTLSLNSGQSYHKELKTSSRGDPLMWSPIKSGLEDVESTVQFQFLEAESFFGTYGTNGFNTQPTKIKNDSITGDNISVMDPVLLDSPLQYSNYLLDFKQL